MSDWRHIPERPRLPPAFVCAIVFWVTCARVYSSCESHVTALCAKLSLACACTSLVFAASLFLSAGISAFEKRHEAQAAHLMIGFFAARRIALVLLATGAAGFSLALGYSTHVTEVGERALSGEPRQIDVTLLEDCAEGTYLPRALCRMSLEGGG